MATQGVKVILGTMTIPAPLTKELAREALELFAARGHNEVDTAIMYQGGNSEATLGELDVTSRFKVAIKGNPWYKDGKTYDDPVGGLAPDQLKEQIQKSLTSLRASRASIFYLHAPDHDTPIGETLKAVKDLHEKGLFEEWGLSNYASWQVVDVHYRCKELGMPPPTVYQGMYNAVTREVERELLPALRSLGMKFYAYNPLAGGILTGRWKLEDEPSSGRFNVGTIWGQRYRDRFWRPALFHALEEVKVECATHGVTTTAAALRWLRHHSKLKGELGDGVIIGGSSVIQIAENILACEEGPLEESIVLSLDKAWVAAEPGCPKYFR